MPTKYSSCDDYNTFLQSTNYNDALLDFVKPNELYLNIFSIQTKIGNLHNDFIKHYIDLKNNGVDINNNYANDLNKIQNINSELFSLSNSVDSNLEDINFRMDCFNKNIDIERETKNTLSNGDKNLKDGVHAAFEQIYDYKRIYEEGYLRNWGLVISIIIVGFLIKNIYSNINGDMNQSVKTIGNNIYNNAKSIGNNLYNNTKNVGSNLYNNVK